MTSLDFVLTPVPLVGEDPPVVGPRSGVDLRAIVPPRSASTAWNTSTTVLRVIRDRLKEDTEGGPPCDLPVRSACACAGAKAWAAARTVAAHFRRFEEVITDEARLLPVHADLTKCASPAVRR